MPVLIVQALLTTAPTLVIIQPIALVVESVILVGEWITLKKKLLVKGIFLVTKLKGFAMCLHLNHHIKQASTYLKRLNLDMSQ